MPETLAQKKSMFWIRLLSVAIPLAVAIVIGLPYKLKLGEWVYIIPHIIGAINTLTSVFLILAFIAIRRKKVIWHKRFNALAFVLGAIFLGCYVVYHVSAPSTPYGDDGFLKYAYYCLLISHILLSVGVVPLVLLAFYYALSGMIGRHKRIVKYTFPIWLYVSVTGVIVYLMIRPYYPF